MTLYTPIPVFQFHNIKTQCLEIVEPLPYSGWAFSGLLTDGGEGSKSPSPPPKICHAYSTIMKNVKSYTLPKEDPKNI